VVPDDVNVTDLVIGEPTATLPKLKLVALTVSWGSEAAAPVPLNATVEVPPLLESLLIVIWPVTDPVAVGLN
jgi:hypothetical protein